MGEIDLFEHLKERSRERAKEREELEDQLRDLTTEELEEQVRFCSDEETRYRKLRQAIQVELFDRASKEMRRHLLK